MADKEFSGNRHNLTGFSTSDAWDKVQETGAWSHYPVSNAPKMGNNPVEAGPQRESLWNNQNERAASDDTVVGGF